MRILFLMFTLIFSSAVFAQQLPANNPHAIIYKEGTHYSTLDAPVPTIVDNSTSVEITEIFRFGCPACARFETSINVCWRSVRFI